MEPGQVKRRFEGYQSTPLLWEGVFQGLTAFKTERVEAGVYPEVVSNARIRFGKLMEQFVLFELEEDPTVNLLGSNLQVFRGKDTLGEIDCLIRNHEINVHLEIVFKFYLYDPDLSPEINRWVGPNRKDSLILKLNKLKERQLPLLHLPETAQILNQMELKAGSFEQAVNFKAQLFVPWKDSGKTYPLVNPECIIGFYLKEEELNHFADHEFYIPTKLDWVVEPHEAVTWMKFHQFKKEVKVILEQYRSPMCWMRSKNGEMQKFFVVFF